MGLMVRDALRAAHHEGRAVSALEFARTRRYGRGLILTPTVELQKLVPTIYKICSASAWREAERQGVYRGSADDARDGYIHFSTAAKVTETARKFFTGQTGLFLVEIDGDALGNALRWERSRNDELFPHLYGELDLGAVRGVQNLQLRGDGSHALPELKS